MLISALFAGDPLLEAIADGGPERIDRRRNADDPAVAKVQIALLNQDPNALGGASATGHYGELTAAAVRRFKIEVLGIPEAEAFNDVGPQTVNKLDELQAQFEGPATPPAILHLIDEYGNPLANLAFTLDDGSGPVPALTDGGGTASVQIGATAGLELDPGSAIAALGDLLDREWPSQTSETEAITTPFTELPIAVDPGVEMFVVVVSRLAYEAQMAAPPEGDVRIEGEGLRIGFDDEGLVVLALQANGGFPTTVFVDPPTPEIGALPLPELVGWVPPDGYVVREGDTAASLGELFLGDAARFAELSDHDPVPGETLALPPAAVPGWLSLALDPPPQPQSQQWFTVVPDDLLRVLYADADPTPLFELLTALEAAPSPGQDPGAASAARAQALAAILSLPEPLGPEEASDAADA